MVRTPLLVRSVVNGKRILAALLFIVIGLIPFGFLAAGSGAPPHIVLIGIGLIGYSILSLMNIFLEYPRLVLTGDQLAIWPHMFWPKRYDLTPYGPAYAVHHNTRAGLGTVLGFRTLADEAAHRAEEKFAYAPTYEEAALKIPADNFVARDTEKAEALAAQINAHCGLG
jgi:xanthosine utilization system XapX-like protein